MPIVSKGEKGCFQHKSAGPGLHESSVNTRKFPFADRSDIIY